MPTTDIGQIHRETGHYWQKTAELTAEQAEIQALFATIQSDQAVPPSGADRRELVDRAKKAGFGDAEIAAGLAPTQAAKLQRLIAIGKEAPDSYSNATDIKLCQELVGTTPTVVRIAGRLRREGTPEPETGPFDSVMRELAGVLEGASPTQIRCLFREFVRSRAKPEGYDQGWDRVLGNDETCESLTILALQKRTWTRHPDGWRCSDGTVEMLSASEQQERDRIVAGQAALVKIEALEAAEKARFAAIEAARVAAEQEVFDRRVAESVARLGVSKGRAK